MRVKLLLSAAVLALPMAAHADDYLPDLSSPTPNQLENQRIDEEFDRRKADLWRDFDAETERDALRREIARQRDQIESQQRQLDLEQMRRYMPDH